MNQADIARRWKLSAPTVWRMVKEGMPTTSIEEAQEWRDNRPRAKARREKEAKKGKVAKSKAPDPEQEIQSLEDEGNSWAGLNTTERLHRHLDQIHERMDFARKEANRWLQDDSELSRKWLTLEAQLAAKAPAVERMIQEALDRQKVTITTIDAQSAFTGFLLRLRGLMDTMPSSMAAKTNPSDPDHAREQLEQWRDAVLFKTLSTKPDVTQ